MSSCPGLLKARLGFLPPGGPSSQEGGGLDVPAEAPGAAVLGSILFLESDPLQPRDPRKGPWHPSPNQQRCPSLVTADALSLGSRCPACSISSPSAHLAAAEYRCRCPASLQENTPGGCLTHGQLACLTRNPYLLQEVFTRSSRLPVPL